MLKESSCSNSTTTAGGIPSLTRPECLPPQHRSDEPSQFTDPSSDTEENCLLQCHPQPNRERALTCWDGVCLVVCQQIGSGIFSTPALVNKNTGSVGMALLFWIISGCIAWTGACGSRSPDMHESDCSLLR